MAQMLIVFITQCSSSFKFDYCVFMAAAEKDIPLLHSSSAPLNLSFAARHSFNSVEKLSSMRSAETERQPDDQHPSRRRRTLSVPALVFSATLQKFTGPFDTIRKQVSMVPTGQ